MGSGSDTCSKRRALPVEEERRLPKGLLPKQRRKVWQAWPDLQQDQSRRLTPRPDYFLGPSS